MLTDAPLQGAWVAPGDEENPRLQRLARLPLWRLGAYTGAGIISGVANVALFHLAVHAHLATYLAWMLAFEVGAILAFVLHRNVTWRDRRVRSALGMLRQMWRAQFGSLAALMVNLAIFSVLVRVGLPGDLDDAAGLVAGFALNYLLAHHYIYGPVRYREGWHHSRRT